MRTAFFAVFALLGALPAQAAPITTVYNVQFISVCADNGTSCAPVPVPLNPTDPTRNLDNALDIMNRAYEQEGVRFAPVMSGNTIDIKHVNSTALQTPSLRVDPALNTVISADGFAELTRGTHLASIGVSPSSSTLNLFFVNDVRPVDANGASVPNATIRGVGWLNGNGVVVDRDARLDTLSHEIGHNLGLNHAAESKNLMASGDNRKPIITTINDVAPGGQQLNQLTAAQGVDARSPLFANGTARVLLDSLGAISNVDSEDMVSGARLYNFDFEQTATQRKLAKLQFFYAPGTEVVGTGVRIDTADAVILEVLFGTPLEPGDEFQFRTNLGHSVPLGEDFLPVDPLFVRYVFDNGVASQALFDAGGDMASDDPTSQFLFVGVPDVNGRPLAQQGSEIEISIQVPEPQTLALFASALAGFFWISRRRRVTAAVPFR